MKLENLASASTQIFQDAFDASQNGIIITDNQQTDNPIIYCNESFEKITGYDTDEVIGKNCRFLQGDNKLQPGVSTIKAAVKKGISCKVDIKNYKKNGELFYNELYIAPLRDNFGVVTHFIGIQNDVTERINAQNELQIQKHAAETALKEKNTLINETRVYIGNILETLNEAIIVLDARLQIIEANKAFYAMFKTSVKETYGELIFKFNNGLFDIYPMRNLIEKILPVYSPFNDFIVDHHFDNIGNKVLRINAKKIIAKDYYKNRILIAIEDRTLI